MKLYPHACIDCGAVRHTTAKPGSSRAPTRCKACLREVIRKTTCRMMKQPFLEPDQRPAPKR